jgi:uncharacterized membrane protein
VSFWSIARNAAAAESGRARAEQYRRRAQFWRVVGWVLVASFLGYCWIVGH